MTNMRSALSSYHISDAGEACLQSITSGLMYSRVPHIDIITWSSLSLNLGIVIMSVMMTVMWLAVCTEPLRKTEVDDPEVVVVVGVGEHDVEWLEVQVEDPLAVYEVHTSHYLQFRGEIRVKSESWL